MPRLHGSGSDAGNIEAGRTSPDGRRDAPTDASAGMTLTDASWGVMEPTFEPTLGAIQREIFRPTCAAVFCHKDDRLGFDASSLARSYDTLVNVRTETPDCGPTGLIRVVPGDPSQSLLYLKLTEPPCGRKMPLLFDPNLDPAKLDQIRQWIERGAPLD